MRDEKTLATFKIDKNNWLDFQALATANETNATKLLREFIAAALDGRIDFESLQTIEQPTFNIDEQISVALSPLLAVITEMRVDIEVLKSDRSLSPKSSNENELQQTLDHRAIHSYIPKKASDMLLSAPVVKPLLGMGDDAVCPKCGSSELVRKGKSESVDKKEGLTGRRVKCKVCQKMSTLWEAVDLPC